MEPGHAHAVLQALFSEGGTLGARVIECHRPELDRVSVDVSSPYGSVSVKLGLLEGKVVSAKPEHDQCAALARRAGVSYSTVADSARRAAPAIGSRWEASK